MNCILLAAIVNNEAASLLGSDAPDRKLFQTFRKALAMLENVDVHDNQSGHLVQESTIMTKSIEISSRSACKQVKIAPADITSVSKNSTGQEGNFIYNRPFIFKSSCIKNIEATKENIHFFSAVIMFNMGLTFHLSKKNRSEDKKENKVLRLYDMTLVLLQKASCTITDCYDMIIATLNNKAQVHCDLHQFDEARKAFDVLFNIMSSSPECDASSAFGERDVEGFYLNGKLLNDCPSCAHAA